MSYFSAASDLAAGAADVFAGTAYGQAAKLAGQQAQVAQRSGDIQEEQLNRQIYQTVSAAGAIESGGGLAAGGSNQYIARASQEQGGLAKAITANQTQINVAGYKATQAADTGQEYQAYAMAASEAAKAAGSLFSI